MRKWAPLFSSICALAVIVSPLTACAPAPRTKVEIYSSWTTGPEAVGLEQLSEQFHAAHPDAEIVNAALAAGPTPPTESVAGRLLSGKPPDSFQARIGQGFITRWVDTGYMEPLDSLYMEGGLKEVIPPAIVNLVSYRGHPYSVPVNIHQANVLFYNKAVLQTYDVDPASLGSFEDWAAAASKLSGAGVTPLALGDIDPWTSAQLFETVLIGTLGPAGYRDLWTGDGDWEGPEVTRALENFSMMLGYANPDHSSLTWDQANQLVIDGKAAMTIMSDWVERDYIAKGFTGYGWRSPPGNEGTFDIFGDSFGIATGAKHADLANEFLSALGSKQGQEAFNDLQGALCARNDCDYSAFDPYFQSSAQAFKTSILVPSAVQGAAAPDDWSAAYIEAISVFVKSGDIAATQHALSLACRSAGVCR